MIYELSKNDIEWRKIAVKICKDKYLADDLVQEMYIRLSDKNYTISTGLVYTVLKSMFLDLKKKKTKEVELIENIVIYEERYNFSKDQETQIKLDKLKIEISKLNFESRELLELSQIMSQKEIEKQTNISYRQINYKIKKTKEKLWQKLKK
jgi:RNA polymerase sigma factor (sigma-70 family)